MAIGIGELLAIQNPFGWLEKMSRDIVRQANVSQEMQSRGREFAGRSGMEPHQLEVLGLLCNMADGIPRDRLIGQVRRVGLTEALRLTTSPQEVQKFLDRLSSPVSSR